MDYISVNNSSNHGQWFKRVRRFCCRRSGSLVAIYICVARRRDSARAMENYHYIRAFSSRDGVFQNCFGKRARRRKGLGRRHAAVPAGRPSGMKRTIDMVPLGCTTRTKGDGPTHIRSNQNNQKLLAMHTDRIHMVYYSFRDIL